MSVQFGDHLNRQFSQFSVIEDLSENPQISKSRKKGAVALYERETKLNEK